MNWFTNLLKRPEGPWEAKLVETRKNYKPHYSYEVTDGRRTVARFDGWSLASARRKAQNRADYLNRKGD